MKRSCGVLLPVTCLPSDYGIGGFTKEAYEFVDYLVQAGQKWWQILPLGQTGEGDSPYQSVSTFAMNPYFIDPGPLIDAGYLTKEQAQAQSAEFDPRYVDYERVFRSRIPLLKEAYLNSPYCMPPAAAFAGREHDREREEFTSFQREEAYWLRDYTLFCAVKDAFGGKSYLEWDEDIRLRKPDAMTAFREKYAEETRFYAFMQFILARQWRNLKAYANGKGIRILGDIPIYVAQDSADVWSRPELFALDKEGRPVKVAGCPPDAFSATGQLWGNPLYLWDEHRKTGYEWWISRLRHVFKMYDAVRIDHFRGFDEYWAVPYGDKTSQNGAWLKGPGIELFEAVEKALGDQEIIAEDLGFLTETVGELLKKTGYPGMKVLQFAFSPCEDSPYLPHNYTENCVVYTGTHDNNTTRGWFAGMSAAEKEFASEYANVTGDQEVSWAFIRLAMESVAWLAIIPMQDYLDIGEEGRINMPSTTGNNWKWRLLRSDLTPELAQRMKKIAQIYRR